MATTAATPTLEVGDQYPTLEIRAAGLFARPDFQEWLNRRTGQGLATWHVGGAPSEMSDVFVTYDHGDGDESSDNPDGMPEPCWTAICRAVERAGATHAIVRLIND